MSSTGGSTGGSRKKGKAKAGMFGGSGFLGLGPKIKSAPRRKKAKSAPTPKVKKAPTKKAPTKKAKRMPVKKAKKGAPRRKAV